MSVAEETSRPTASAASSAGGENGLGSPFNLPNIITLSRLLLAFVLFALMGANISWLLCAVVFIVAAATDALDGYFARKYGQITVLGRILDPFVDKFIVCGSFVFLQSVPDSGVSPWLTLIVLAREMFITSLRGFLEQRGKDFSAVLSGKLKMVLQCVAIGACLVALDPLARGSALGGPLLWLRDIAVWSAAVVTVWSGVAYSQRAIAMLSRHD
jgi:CDP-diacylglycerol---glycerol-3-phosphate 3-phosphatidyltransferase